VNGFDISAGVILLAAGIWSFFRGLTREVISILGMTAAVVMGSWGAPSLAALIQPFIATPWLRQAFGFAAIFLAVVIAYFLLAKIVRRMVDAAGLSLPDCILGSLFGILKATVLIALSLLVLSRFDPDTASRLTQGSQLAPPLFKMAQLLTALLPENLDTDFDRFYNRFQRLRQEQLPIGMTATGLRPKPPITVEPHPVPEAPAGISPQDDQSLRQLLQNLERKREH